MSDHIPDLTKMVSDTPICDSTPHNVADLGMLCRRLERQLNAANDRIKRLEEAGDGMQIWITVIRGYLPECTNNWRKAKEAKL
jgi:hypothetical protein